EARRRGLAELGKPALVLRPQPVHDERVGPVAALLVAAAAIVAASLIAGGVALRLDVPARGLSGRLLIGILLVSVGPARALGRGFAKRRRPRQCQQVEIEPAGLVLTAVLSRGGPTWEHAEGNGGGDNGRTQTQHGHNASLEITT